jgi:hypothetical protein
VRPRDDAKFVGSADASKGHEVADVSLIGTSSTGVVEIGEPFGFCWYGRELMKLLGSKMPLFFVKCRD